MKLKPKPTRAGRRSKITYTQVHPKVWKKALEISNNNPKRLEILDEKTVRVKN